MKNQPGLAIGFSNVGHFYTHMFIILYATAVLHLPQVFDVGYGELLSLSSTGLVLFGVAALPAGWLGDRWSQVGMIVVFFAGVGISALLIGFSADVESLFIGLTLLGLFAAIYHPVGIAWLVANARQKGISLGINGVFGNVGSASAPVFVGLMIDYVSWRAAFLIPGTVALVTALILAIVWARGWVTDVKADRDPLPPPDPGNRRRVVMVLTLTMACNGIIYTGLTTTIPKVFETGLGPSLASSYTEIGLFAGAVIGLSSIAGVFGGWLADRFSARSIYYVFWFLSVPPLFLVTQLGGVELLAIALLAMALNVSFSAAENMLVAENTPFEWRSLAYGARFVIALGVGGVAVWVAGQVFDRTGSFDLLYVAFAAAALIAGGAATLLPRPGAPRPAIAPAE